MPLKTIYLERKSWETWLCSSTNCAREVWN